jgi:hypothetical protein
MTTFNKIKSNNTGTFTKQDSVDFDLSLWYATNGVIDWSKYPNQIPYTEQDVFHTQLTHTPSGNANDIGWTIRIGKGGHIYYIDLQGLGQLICPNRHMSPWNDDCMTTTVFSRDERNEDPEMGGHESFSNGYLHGSGMYIKPQMDPLNNKPFYNPILGEKFNPDDRSYSVINWGLVPKPNINRGDVLFYSRYRDMGNGVIEITFYCYNFGNRIYNFAENPWFAFRPSKFPNMVEGIDGSPTFKINNKGFGDGAIPGVGGWGAGTVNPSDPNSLTCALVWGTQSRMNVNFGFVDKGERDMMLLAPSAGFLMPYGKGIRYRRYVVLGKLTEVAQICKELNSEAFFESIEFTTDYSGRLPIYQTTLEGQNILTTTPTGSPIGQLYPIPVKNSLPIILMKNNDTGKYFISSDPYAICGKVPFTNPYPFGHEKYETYQNRHIYQSYDGKTEWISLLGYALPVGDGKIGLNSHIPLSNILGDVAFIAGEKLNANELMVLSPTS